MRRTGCGQQQRQAGSSVADNTLGAALTSAAAHPGAPRHPHPHTRVHPGPLQVLFKTPALNARLSIKRAISTINVTAPSGMFNGSVSAKVLAAGDAGGRGRARGPASTSAAN